MADDTNKVASNLNKNNNKSRRFPSKEHNLRKRQPQRLDNRDTVIYVSSKSNVKALLERCDKLIRNEENEIIIYCMGAAIQKGILLALQVCEKHLTYKVSTNTLTTELIDDLEPATDDVDYDIQKRNNSALRIRVFRNMVEALAS